MHAPNPLLAGLVPAVVLVAPAVGQAGHVRALEDVVMSRSADKLERFIDEHLSARYAKELGRDGARSMLEDLREKCGNPGGIMGQPLPPNGFEIVFETDDASWRVGLTFEDDPPGKIDGLEVTPYERAPGIDPFTWDNFSARMDEYAREGFCGSVYVVHNGTVVLHRGYGFADREREHPIETDTIFAIGSTPIDFTRAAILLLEERGKLSTSDPITKFFDTVPKDKRGITLRHLMSGRSGLLNFHGKHGVDEDLDLTWIDRAEALERIFGSELLFEPGSDYAHSHSAWGVLAAIVEVASGSEYHAFLQSELFEPAGMTRTGPYPLTHDFDASEVACGVAVPGVGETNSPREWGKTSWLVKGSGGMVSTTIDMARWFDALASGRLLSHVSLCDYWSSGPLSGGNDRGFLCSYAEGPYNGSIVMCNSHEDSRDLAAQIGRELATLTSDEGQRFSIGIGIDRTEEGVRVLQVTPNGPAARAGVRVGDGVVAVQGKPGASLMRAMFACARSGEPLEFTAVRDGKRMEVSIQPESRASGGR